MKPTMLRTAVLVVAFSSLCLSAQAAPTVSGVSGTVVTGRTIQVTGVSFGSKSPAAPYVWADFENGINPSPLGQKTSWNGVNALSWTTTEGYKGTGGIKASDGNGNWTLRTDYSSWTKEGQHSYIFRRMKQNFLVSDASQNWKVWRA